MSAKNGSAVTLRKRSLVAVCVAAAFVLCAVFSSAASAKVPIKETYLALGDSFAFGYSLQLEHENAAAGDPATAFEHGYVNDYFNDLKPKANGIQLQNLGCPGETTESFVGKNPAVVAGLEAAGAYNGKEDLEDGVGPVKFSTKNIKGEKETSLDTEEECAYHNSAVAEAEAQHNKIVPESAGYKLPLHVEYADYGAKSQLEAAIAAIATDASVGKPVTTLSIDIGGNDQLHFIKQCTTEGEAYGAGVAYETVLLPHGFNGYGLLAFDPTATEAQIVEYAFGEAGAADVPVYLEAVATVEKAAEEFVTTEPEAISGHPPNGCLKSRLPAVLKRISGNVYGIVAAIRNGAALGGINYTGKIVDLLNYNPYGNVAKRATTREELNGVNYELLKGSNPLAYVSNFYFEGAAKLAALGLYENPVTKADEPTGGASGEICIAETLKKFNTQTGLEPGHLQRWTNMANATESEVEIEGKKYEAKNGPDIHPTPLGYTQMANTILKEATCTP